MSIESEAELQRIQATMPTPYMPLKYSSRLLKFLGHYHKIWTKAGAFPPTLRDEMRNELQAALKTLTACMYDWVG
jgi:hypothetical protein